MSTYRRGAWLLTLALAISACAGAKNASSTSTTPDAPDAVAPGETWASMSLSKRKAHMNEHVVPVMESHFKRHDPQRYAAFSCETCHGADMVARNFKMPNPSLLALHPTGSQEQHEMVESYPEMVKLMFNHVLPDMQTLLGAPAYDPNTKAGFSCYVCHPSAQPAVEASL